MKRMLALILATACMVASPALKANTTTKPLTAKEKIQALTYKPLEFEIPEAERVELKNGIVVYLLMDKTLPKINIQSIIHTGQIYEDQDKAGLAAFCGYMLREGGTKSMTVDQINEKLEYIAASISTDITREHGTANLFALTEHLDTALTIYADILRNPAFDEAKIQQHKNELYETFRRENDEPDDIVGRTFREVLYKNHPYSRRIIGYNDNVKSITRKDLQKFHKRYFVPNNIILGISGDFNRETMLEKLEQHFGSWKKRKTRFPALPDLTEEFKRELFFIEKDIPQSHFFLCHLGVNRLHPDYFKIKVMNYILGASGFNSRLVNQVRTASGLAYSVGSFFHFPQFPGFFLCYCQTKTERTEEAIQKIIAVLETMQNEPVSEAEFVRAKEALKNQFIFQFQTSAKILNQLMFIEYQGLPSDYLQTYLKNIDSVTIEDITQVARDYIHPDKLKLVLVGNKAVLDTFPDDFGSFTVIDLESDHNQ